jgi:flagellar hook-associated protein 1 FlgK
MPSDNPVSINTLFELSRRSFQAFDASMKAASQNVANANTEGYDRRRVTLEASNVAAPGLYAAPHGAEATGNGVTVASYERMRDRLLDASAARAQTNLGAATEEARVLTQLEGALATGTDGALSATMESFWDGWTSVANNPEDSGVRNTLLSKTDTLVASFQRLDQSISQRVTDTQEALATSVEAVNGQLEEMASLNATIREARANGSPDLVAEDRRDTLVNDLSESLPVEVQEKEDGYTLTVNGMSVVQGDEATTLTLAAPDTVEFGDTGVGFQPGDEGGGTIGAQVRLLADTLPTVQNDLDDLASQVVTEVNTIHRQGFNQDGTDDTPFFDPAGTTAGTMQRAVTDPADVAAYGAPGAPGDTTPAQNIAALSESLTPQAIDLASGIGAKVEHATAQEESQSALAGHLDSMAQGVSGVSIDEEMTNLIEHQQAFSASARVLRTAQTVMDTLLSI